MTLNLAFYRSSVQRGSVVVSRFFPLKPTVARMIYLGGGHIAATNGTILASLCWCLAAVQHPAAALCAPSEMVRRTAGGRPPAVVRGGRPKPSHQYRRIVLHYSILHSYVTSRHHSHRRVTLRAFFESAFGFIIRNLSPVCCIARINGCRTVIVIHQLSRP